MKFENLDVIFNEENYVPHYQPILNSLNRKILGYEVLGRWYSHTDNDFLSLGPFFHQDSYNISQKIQVDRIIREKAIRYLKESGANTKLFFNLMPNILSKIHQEELIDPDKFHLIQLIEKYEIDRSNIVIEITEDEFSGKTERLLNMVEILRNYGFKIAIDDMGSGFSNLERIGYIHPDIIKVDIRIMRESLNRNSFRQVLSAISDMSFKLGCELLFEGVETEKELTLALSMGANLLQGFYFSKAISDFKNKNFYAEDLRIILEKFSGIRFLELVEDRQKQQELIDRLKVVFEGIDPNLYSDIKTYNDLLKSVLPSLPTDILEISMLDMHGYQISPTYFKGSSGVWIESGKHIGDNYAWKPYFTQHKADSYFFNKHWRVTDPLYDIQNQVNYIIFTFNLSNNLVFIVKVKW